jgi:hypothetical protein
VVQGDNVVGSHQQQTHGDIRQQTRTHTTQRQ